MSNKILDEAREQFTDLAKQGVDELNLGSSVRKLLRELFKDFTTAVEKKFDAIASKLIRMEAIIVSGFDGLDGRLNSLEAEIKKLKEGKKK